MGSNGSGLLPLLVAHGVPERGARIYLAAARGGPRTVSELARAAALNRVEAYRVIEQLVESGVLRPTSGRPRRFEAIAVAQLVDGWIARATDHLRRLEADRGKLVERFEDHLASDDHSDFPRLTVFEGRDSIFKFLDRRIGAAEREVLLSVSGFALAPAIDGGMDRSLEAARDRGLKVQLVTEITGANLFEAKHFGGLVDVRHSIVPVTSRAIVIDGGGALVYVSGADGLGTSDDEQVAVWSTAPKLVRRARDYHRRLWGRAVPAPARVVALEDRPNAVVSVTPSSAEEPFRPLGEVARLGLKATGLPELELDVPELIESIAAQFGRQIARNLDGATPKEVARSLSEYYQKHALGQLTIDRERPLVLRVRQCFACLPQSPEVGRVLCPGILRSVLESRTGARWAVSKPDPRRHARHGCVFTANPG